MTVVGFIGLGRMGYAMASRLRSYGFDVVVWNRTPTKMERFIAEHGGRAASTPAEVAEKADIVHIMVADDNASREVLLRPNGVFERGRGKIVIEHSTITPMHSIFLQRLAEKHGITYLEAPVIGGPRNAADGKLVILVAGSRKPEEIPSLSPLGTTIHLGDVPQATAAKLAFNLLLLTIVAGLAEAYSLVEAYGVPYREFYEKVLSKTWIRPIAERYIDRGFRLGAPASFAAQLAGKDAAYAAEALREKGLPNILASAIEELYNYMVMDGYGESDYPTLIGYLVSRTMRRK